MIDIDSYGVCSGRNPSWYIIFVFSCGVNQVVGASERHIISYHPFFLLSRKIIFEVMIIERLRFL